MRAGVKVVWIAAAGLSAACAGTASAQEACADRLDGIESALADADLPAGQRQDIDKVLQGARDLAAAGEEEGCQRIAETLDQLRASLAVTGEVEGGLPGQEPLPRAGDRPAGAEGQTETPPEGGLTASQAEELIGRQVVAVVNFESRNIAGFMSEVLVLGVPDEEGNVTLLRPDKDVPVGGRVY
jgi:hypothetical protein